MASKIGKVNTLFKWNAL